MLQGSLLDVFVVWFVIELKLNVGIHLRMVARSHAEGWRAAQSIIYRTLPFGAIFFYCVKHTPSPSRFEGSF